MKRERAAIYCRLSEEDKGKGSTENDSNSIQNQRALLTEYAHSHGWEIYEIYIDDDYSGADRSRPACTPPRRKGLTSSSAKHNPVSAGN